jgi:hypothetical protein
MLASMLDTHACMWHAPYVLPIYNLTLLTDETNNAYSREKKNNATDDETRTWNLEMIL